MSLVCSGTTDMRRREFINLMGRAAAGWPLAAKAQQPAGKFMRIGFLMSYRGGDPEGEQRLAAFRDSLRQAGWVDGVAVRIEVRWFAGDPEQARVHARELVEQSPDLIVANGTPAV